MIIKTDNKDLNCWIAYFQEKNKSLIKFVALLNKVDKRYLFHKNEFPYDDPVWDILPANGFLEKDLRIVLDSLNHESTVDAEDVLLSKTRLVLALNSGIKFEGWLEFFGDDLTLAFARALIEGTYEQFGFDFPDIAKVAILTGVLTKDDFFGVGLMRGNMLGRRYPDDKAEKELKSLVKKNKVKIKIQEKLLPYI